MLSGIHNMSWAKLSFQGRGHATNLLTNYDIFLLPNLDASTLSLL